VAIRHEIVINGKVFDTEVASTQEETRKGLSNRVGLSPNTGMLFIFEGDALRTFWMRDMFIPIDIVWINSAGIVVGTDENIRPPRPGAALRLLPLYASGIPCKYVLEVNAGEALHVQSGMRVENLPQQAVVVALENPLDLFKGWFEKQTFTTVNIHVPGNDPPKTATEVLPSSKKGTKKKGPSLNSPVLTEKQDGGGFGGTVATSSDSGTFTTTYGGSDGKKIKRKLDKLKQWVAKQTSDCHYCRHDTANEDDHEGDFALSEDDVYRLIGVQKGPPGPPPREGLKWKEQTHRWIRPEEGGADKESYDVNIRSTLGSATQEFTNVPTQVGRSRYQERPEGDPQEIAHEKIVSAAEEFLASRMSESQYKMIVGLVDNWAVSMDTSIDNFYRAGCEQHPDVCEALQDLTKAMMGDKPIMMYRGIGDVPQIVDELSASGDTTAVIKSKKLSSWTPDRGVAEFFADPFGDSEDEGLVMEMEVSPEDVFAPVFAFGSPGAREYFDQKEYILKPAKEGHITPKVVQLAGRVLDKAEGKGKTIIIPDDVDALGPFKNRDLFYEDRQIQKQPGPPPRPGLKWKEETHHWIRPTFEPIKEDKTGTGGTSFEGRPFSSRLNQNLGTSMEMSDEHIETLDRYVNTNVPTLLQPLGEMFESDEGLQEDFHDVLREDFGDSIAVFRGYKSGRLEDFAVDYTNVTTDRGVAVRFGGKDIDEIIIDTNDAVGWGSLSESELIIPKRFLEKAIQKQHGPPPRPGLKWKDETHRWIRPEEGSDDSGFSPGYNGEPEPHKRYDQYGEEIKLLSPEAYMRKIGATKKYRSAASKYGKLEGNYTAMQFLIADRISTTKQIDKKTKWNVVRQAAWALTTDWGGGGPKIPNHHLRKIKSLAVSHRSRGGGKLTDHQGNEYGEATASANKRLGRITIWNADERADPKKFPGSDKSDGSPEYMERANHQYFFMSTMVHELAHLQQPSAGWAYGAIKYEFKQAIAKNQFPSTYAKRNPNEFYAECYEAYVMWHDEFVGKNPSMAKLLESFWNVKSFKEKNWDDFTPEQQEGFHWHGWASPDLEKTEEDGIFHDPWHVGAADLLDIDGEESIQKAVMDTPSDKDGKFDSTEVPSGASVWITVTNPESPLHGRHILITRRPDGLFALTGGGGVGDEDEEVSARRHVVLTGTPKKTKRDEALEEEINEAKKHNEPLIAARKEIDKETRKEISTAADEMLGSLGIKDIDKKEMLEKKDEVQNHVESVIEDKTEAKRITDTIMRYATRAESKVNRRVGQERQIAVARVGKRLRRLRDEEVGPAIEEELMPREDLTLTMPNLSGIEELTPTEAEHKIAKGFEAQVESYFDGDETPPAKDDEPTIEHHVAPLEVNSVEQLQSSVSRMQNYHAKRAEAEQIKQQIKKVPLAQITPSTLADIKLEIAASSSPMSMEDIENKSSKELDHWMRDTSAMGFYDAVSTYWNDDTSLVERLNSKDRIDTVMKAHVDAGAATALAALAKEHLGLSMDTARLIKASNIELATATIALQIRQKFGADAIGYDAVLAQVRGKNSMNQMATEQKALERHGTLKGQYDEIQRQKSNAELLDRVKISGLESQNLIEQRKNLGAALGSLQASGTFYDQLAKFKSAKDDVVKINVGAKSDDAEALVSRLGIKKGYSINTSDPDNVTVDVGVSSLGRLISTEKDLHDKHDAHEAIKTNTEGVSEDAMGNMVVDNYNVPGWKDSFVDESGETQSYKWRVEQRNDIDWLLESTKKSEGNPDGQGGGLITRTVGAGKTNTALGFFGNKISENPNYKGLIAVPKGRAQQWVDEAKKFTDMNIELIPDGTAKDKVEDILANSKPGTVYVTGHREISRAHETLEAMQGDDSLGMKFDGLVIDEPQELQSRGKSGSIGAVGKRIMKLPVQHRIGLTATPARRNPLEAYDLIKWTQGSTKEIGSKASFNRTFSGFGSGTNAQDTAISKLYFDTIKPYISGDKLTDPTFKVHSSMIGVNRTSTQVARQKEIEANSGTDIESRRKELVAAAHANPKHPLRRSMNWEATLSTRATNQARKEFNQRHIDNMDGGDFSTNAKLQALRSELEQDRDKKHVVYIDSKYQRRAMVGMFKDMGISTPHIKNIASTTTSITGKEMAQRVKDFKTNPDVNIIMIDKDSASGYNLQQGDALHVMGSPVDAANYMQAQGRIARMPRQGDVDIKTYRYEDNPTEAAHWNDLDSQLKVLRATSPAMFAGR
jgi:uncharacterized membrane protein (UPF0127 family)